MGRGRVRAQPLVAVADVPASSRWYQAVLGCESAHGGDEYEMLISGGELVLQLHAWDVDDHPNLTGRSASPTGHGVLLWFETAAFDDCVEAAGRMRATVLEPPHVNPNSGRREIWLRDPDGYVVVVASTQ